MSSSDEEAWGSEEELEDNKTKCLFCDLEFESPHLCLAHCSKEHGFDFKTLKLEYKLGLYDGIKVINYLRTDPQFKNMRTFDKTVLKDKTMWDDEKYLKPVIPDDPLVMQQLNGDDEAEDFSDDEEFVPDFNESLKITENNTNKDNVSLESLSKEELIDLLKQAEKKNTLLQQELEDSFEKITKLQEFGQRMLTDDGTEKKKREKKKTDDDDSSSSEDEREDGYFAAYSRHHIHEDMLKDEVRTGSYHDAVVKNPDTFKDKVVLDVGCGTGILSMFCAKTGAKKVVAVDNSEMIHRAKYIAKENNLSDQINFIKGKMEEIKDLGVEDNKVDIIISEWMGYCLLFEAMLDTVLLARDKFLKPGGLIFPNKASMLICGYTDKEYRDSRINYWKDIYGFKMETLTTEIITEAIVTFADETKVFSDCFNFKDIDIKTVNVDDLNFTSDFKIVAKKDEQLDAFVLYFDIDFNDGVQTPVHFSTGPFTPRTHWATTICYLNEPVDLKQGEVVEGSVTLTKGKSFHRDLDILVIYSIKGKVDNKRQFFNLS